jgi:hypothetical protein
MIPFATTTITITRPAPTDEPYEPPGPPSTVVAGVRAHISLGRGAENVVGGDQEVVYHRLTCDPCDLDNADQVIDDATGLVYDVEYARLRRGLGLDHMEAGLRQVEGVAASVVAGF